MNSIEFSFFIDNDTFKKLTFFTMLDIVMLIIWMVLIFGYAFYKKSQHSELGYYRYYFRNLYFKVFFGFFFSIFYIFYYGGGDTTAYWDMAGCMNKLFWNSPQYYFNNMYYDLNDPEFINKYNLVTGYPPSWIMREHQGFFVSKIVSLFSFITGNSYLTITLLFSSIVAGVSWRFYTMVIDWIPHPSKVMTYTILFIPSVGFWCSGITKDTLVFISILVIVTRTFRLMNGKSRNILWSVVLIVFHLWILYNIRSVILMTLFIPFFIAASSRISNRYSEYIYLKRIVQVLVAGISTVVFFVVIQSYGKEVSVDTYLKEAEIVQKDFANNNAYTGKKYTIEVSDYSLTGVLQTMPVAIVAGLLRPFLWESLSATLVLNGIESAFFMYFLVVFFIRRNLLARIQAIRRNELILFCFFFVVIYGMITGFSSIIFGILVRLRAPLLPFLGILVTFYLKPEIFRKDLEAEEARKAEELKSMKSLESLKV